MSQPCLSLFVFNKCLCSSATDGLRLFFSWVTLPSPALSLPLQPSHLFRCLEGRWGLATNPSS